MMANLAAIDEFGHFGSQQLVAAIGTGGRRQIALELHGRVILGSSLTLRRLCQLQRQAGEAVPTQNSESQRNHGVSLAFRVLSRDRGLDSQMPRLERRGMASENTAAERRLLASTFLMRWYRRVVIAFSPLWALVSTVGQAPLSVAGGAISSGTDFGRSPVGMI